MNLAKGLEPYRHNAVFTQSPMASKDSKYRNAPNSALLHRETAVTAFQYPFALNLKDCAAKPEWARRLLQAIGELNNVAGNHARSSFEMAPASVVVRLTDSLVAGYGTYGFQSDGSFPEVIDGILHEPPDFPGAEFLIGGQIVKSMSSERVAALTQRGVTLERDPRRLLEIVAKRALGD